MGEWDWKNRNVLTPIGAGYRAADSGSVCGFTEPRALAPAGGLPASTAVSRDEDSPLSRPPVLFWDRSDTPLGAAPSEVKRGSFQRFPEQRESQQGCELKATVEISICPSERAVWENPTYF